MEGGSGKKIGKYFCHKTMLTRCCGARSFSSMAMNSPSSAGEQAWLRFYRVALDHACPFSRTHLSYMSWLIQQLLCKCMSLEFSSSQCQERKIYKKKKKKLKSMPAYLFCYHYTRASVRTAASVRGHWCMGGRFMPLGAWSIDSLTSALREAADGSETWAGAHNCYRIRTGVTCRTRLSHVKGVGKRQGDACDVVGNSWLETRLSEGWWHVPRRGGWGVFCIMGISFTQAVVSPERLFCPHTRQLPSNRSRRYAGQRCCCFWWNRSTI